MKIILALVLLLNSLALYAAPKGPICETPAQLMTSQIVGKEFTNICKKMVADDEGCKKLKPEKRMNCSVKNANKIMSSNDLASKIGQCVKGFVWDSMVDLVKFVISLIGGMIKGGVNSAIGIGKFLADPSSWGSKIGNASKLGMAFLNSIKMYFAREYPRNLAKSWGNPVVALGKTLADPVINFITDAVQKMIAHYVPQYQCMNGTAKLYTICRLAGDFIMPPAFLISFMKYGVKGLQALDKGNELSKILRFKKRFGEANELSGAAAAAAKRAPEKPTHLSADAAKGSPARTKGGGKAAGPKPAPKAAKGPAVHPPKPAPVAPLVKPITEHNADELIEIARAEKAASPADEVAAVADANRAELERIKGLGDEGKSPAPKPEEKPLTVDEQKDLLVIESQVDELKATKNVPALTEKYTKDPEYGPLYESGFPEDQISIIIKDMEVRNPNMKKAEVREKVQSLFACEIKK